MIRREHTAAAWAKLGGPQMTRPSENGLEAEKIQQIDIRRDGGQAVVDVAVRGEARARQFAFETYEAGVSFCASLWEQRQRSIGRSIAG